MHLVRSYGRRLQWKLIRTLVQFRNASREDISVSWADSIPGSIDNDLAVKEHVASGQFEHWGSVHECG
jgi:hypothetical protein